MATKEKISTQPLREKLHHIEQELIALRSLFISIVGEDKEGNYHPDFIERVIRQGRESPTHTFTNPVDFLNQLKRV